MISGSEARGTPKMPSSAGFHSGAPSCVREAVEESVANPAPRRSQRKESTVPSRAVPASTAAATSESCSRSQASLPAEKYPFHITRVFPTTEAKEGSNYYKVWVEMEQANASWLPGMEGEARVDVRKEPAIWIYTHTFTDFVRLKLWSWGII